MRKTTIAIIAGMLLLPCAVTSNAKPVAKGSVKQIATFGKHPKFNAEHPALLQQTPKSKKLVAPKDANKLWRAQEQKLYEWNGEDWDWNTTMNVKFDSKGRSIEEISEDYEGIFYRDTYSYNDNDKVVLTLEEVSEDGGNTYTNYAKKEVEYDPIVTDLIISNKEYEWDGDDWVMQGNCYTRTVTRDAQGNVTQVELAVWYNGIFDPTERLNVEYGEDGKANKIVQNVLTYDGVDFSWEIDMTYQNIVWDRTDGQIVTIEGLGIGANRVKSVDQVGDGFNVHGEFTYTGNNFIGILTGEDEGEPVNGTEMYTELDNYGSYVEVYTLSFTEDGEEYVETETYTLKYDANGLLLLEKDELTVNGEIWDDNEIVGTVEYDETNGYPTSYIMSIGFTDYDDDGQEEYFSENMLKVEYGNYVEIDAKVAAIEAEANGEVNYYTLQGVKTSHPEAGNIYIRVQGSKSSKVLVK